MRICSDYIFIDTYEVCFLWVENNEFQKMLPSWSISYFGASSWSQ